MQNLEQFLTEKDRKDILLFDSSDTKLFQQDIDLLRHSEVAGTVKKFTLKPISAILEDSEVDTTNHISIQVQDK